MDKAKAALKISRSQVRLNSDSSDELANSALLDEQNTQLMRPSTQGSTTETRLARSRSSGSATDTLDKPLPPFPSRGTTAVSAQNKQAKATLAPKTTNLKVPAKSGMQNSKLKVSDAILYRGPQDELHAQPSKFGQGNRSFDHIASPKTSTADAAELSKKISDLMQQNAAKDPKKLSKRKDSVRTDTSTSSRPSPLQRSKTAFIKATRAVTGRLTNNTKEQIKTKRKGDVLLESNDDLPHLEAGFLPPIRRGRLDRRIAEGENLSSPKILNMMGNGHAIPRKPLPVYESMKTPKTQSGQMEDPFSDGIDAERAMTPQHPVDLEIGLDIDFSRRKNKRVSRDEGFPFRGLGHTTSAFNFEPSLSTAEAPSKFSNKISGLAQHPNGGIFSSSPVGFSTPRIRLEPRPDAKGKKRLTGVLVRTPSILDFSFEDYQSEEDEPATPAGGSQATDYEHSLSVKRKSAREDLRAQISPSDRNSDASAEDLLTTENNTSGTHDQQPFSMKHGNTKLIRANREKRKAKGMSMFDTGIKGKVPTATVIPRSRSTTGNRSYPMSRPTSILFSRESRAHTRNLSSIEGDSIDIDELQMDG